MLPGIAPVIMGVADIVLIDDGNFAFSSGTTTHTYTGRSSTGPHTFVLLSSQSSNTINVVSATWNGVAGTVLVNDALTADANRAHCAIIYFPGAMSGNLLIEFNLSTSDSHISIVSLTGLQSATPIDTDSQRINSGSATSCDLDNLLTPGVGGVRLACFARYTTSSPSATPWTNATSLHLVDAGSYEHATAYALGDDGSTISNANSTQSNGRCIVGVSLR